MVNAQSSAAGLISLLHDSDPDIQSYAIEELNEVVSVFWAEISEVVADIEALSEPTSPLAPESRQVASLLCSKIYFYLGDLGEAVNLALNAGEAFARSTGEFKETMIAQCLDSFIDQKARGAEVDERLTRIVEGVLDAGKDEGGKLTIGLTLSLRRLDLLEQVYRQSTAPGQGQGARDDELLRYVLSEVTGGASGNEGWSKAWRDELLRVLLRLFSASPRPDYTSIAQIWLQLNDPAAAAATLSELLASASGGKGDGLLQAYQIAFDLADAAAQGFLEQVEAGLPKSEGEDDAPLANLKAILSGEKSIRLYLEFLSKNNHSDLLILKRTKDALESRHSVFHTAVTFMNALANAGTTSDQFLRDKDNFQWLGRASNWAMFSATAALGVIHKGSTARAMTILGPYLPASDAVASAPGGAAYSEGGSLYALGLIHARHGQEVTGYLTERLKTHQDEVVQHGAALGLGMAGMATNNEEVYEEIRNILFQDSSVAGEASGYAMGLVMLGSGSQKALDEMLQYAHETQHEKIIRGLAMGIAFLMYGRAEQADSAIEQLLAEKDSILRYGGMFTIALAYAGTANNKAIRKLLHVAVSDVSDDVRRAAVTALGFVMFRNHAQVPRVVQLLSESYNPHVRHGATMALGISCAGTASTDAIDLLEPMTRDPVDFVRQGAFISLAMILMQYTEAQSPHVKKTRELLDKVVHDKHEDSLAKFGAAMAQGIIDAGGRNVTVALQSKAGTPNMTSIVGMALFAQFWYWFPLAHCLSLSFTPTALIGLDDQLRIPKFDFTCQAKPSQFAYPAPYQPPAKEKVEKVEKAVLSTTAKAQARAKTKEQEKAAAEGVDAMDTDDKPQENGESVKADGKTNEKKEEKPAEPSSFQMHNLDRVTPPQLAHISFSSANRYTPVRPFSTAAASPSAGSSGIKKGKKTVTSDGAAKSKGTIAGAGIILLADAQSGSDSEYHELNKELDAPPAPAAPAPVPAVEAAPAPAAAEAMEVDDGPELDMPPPFEYPFGSDS